METLARGMAPGLEWRGSVEECRRKGAGRRQQSDKEEENTDRGSLLNQPPILALGLCTGHIPSWIQFPLVCK